MRTVYIECDGAKSAADVWQCYLDATQSDEAAMFGRNLDAFWDAIERGGPGWPGDAVLVFKGSSRLAEFDAGSGLNLLQALRWVADEATQTRIELA